MQRRHPSSRRWASKVELFSLQFNTLDKNHVSWRWRHDNTSFKRQWEVAERRKRIKVQKFCEIHVSKLTRFQDPWSCKHPIAQRATTSWADPFALPAMVCLMCFRARSDRHERSGAATRSSTPYISVMQRKSQRSPSGDDWFCQWMCPHHPCEARTSRISWCQNFLMFAGVSVMLSWRFAVTTNPLFCSFKGMLWMPRDQWAWLHAPPPYSTRNKLGRTERKSMC